jgi:hypothetical protein
MQQTFANFQPDYARTVHTTQGETHRRAFLDVRPRHSPAGEGSDGTQHWVCPLGRWHERLGTNRFKSEHGHNVGPGFSE